MPLKLPTAEQFLFAANVLANRLFFKQGYDAAIKRILVVKWDEIGDMATATHVFEILKKNYPNAVLTLLCKPFVKLLVESDPYIDHIITDINGFNKKFDLVVELRGTWSTFFLALLHKAKYRVGRAEVRAENRGHQLHEIETNAAIVKRVVQEECPDLKPRLYFTNEDTMKVNAFIERHGIQKFAILHAGARKVLRQWPLDRFALIADFLKQNYQLDVVFAGTKEDEQQISQITNTLNFKTFLFTDGYSLAQFSCLCSQAAFYIGNESGPLHIASAFSVPLIGLFGPGVPGVFYPVSENSRVLHHVLSCNPCNQIDCVEPANPCINRIQVVDVMNEIEQIMGRLNL